MWAVSLLIKVWLLQWPDSLYVCWFSKEWSKTTDRVKPYVCLKHEPQGEVLVCVWDVQPQFTGCCRSVIIYDSLLLSLVSCSSGRPIMLCSWCAVCWRSSSGRWMKKSCTYSSPTRRGRREPTVSHIHTNKFFTILINLSSQVSFWHVSLCLDLTNIVELVHRQTHWESIDFCCCFGHTLHELTMSNRYVLQNLFIFVNVT